MVVASAWHKSLSTNVIALALSLNSITPTIVARIDEVRDPKRSSTEQTHAWRWSARSIYACYRHNNAYICFLIIYRTQPPYSPPSHQSIHYRKSWRAECASNNTVHLIMCEFVFFRISLHLLHAHCAHVCETITTHLHVCWCAMKAV